MNAVEQSPSLSVDVPLTNVTGVGQAVDFGSAFNTDIVSALGTDSIHAPTNTIQQFEADLAALTGVTNSTVNYTYGNNEIEIGFTSQQIRN